MISITWSRAIVSNEQRSHMDADAVPLAAAVEPKAERAKYDNPAGICFNKQKQKYQARIKGKNADGKMVQHIDRHIPGLFATVELAVEAQAVAQQKWDRGEEVWPAAPGNRNARGQVCYRLRTVLICLASRAVLIDLTPVHAGTEAKGELDERREKVEPRRAALEEEHGIPGEI